MFLHDLLAGITVGLVALPLAMAFGIASGVTPQAGLYTAVVAGFLISALGGSRTQIGGPTGAFVVIVAGIVAKLRHDRAGHGDRHGRNHAAADGPYRAGLGGALYSPQCRHRIHQRHRDADCLDADQGLLRAAHARGSQRVSAAHASCSPRTTRSFNPAALGLGLGTLAILLLLPRFTKRVPASIVARAGLHRQ